MKITQLIENLLIIKETYGDVEVTDSFNEELSVEVIKTINYSLDGKVKETIRCQLDA